MKPYVGITGFTSGIEVELISQFAQRLNFGNDKDYTIMLGFLTSDSRLSNIVKSGTRSPAFADLENLLSLVPDNLLPAIHYHTKDNDSLGDSLIGMFNLFYEQNLCRTVQLNVLWPNVDGLKKAKDVFPDLDIVLQLSHNALNLCENDLLSKVESYGRLVSYVLIDPSGGLGIDYDEGNSLDLLNKLDGILPLPIKGVAGGLSPENVFDRTSNINSNYKNAFCIDAEGKLRSEDNLSLDIGKCINYLSQARLALDK